MSRSLFCCHSAWMLYICKASFLNSQADLLYNIWVLFKPLLYLLQRVCSSFWFHFNFILELTAYSILDCFFSKLFSVTLLPPFFSESEWILFVLLFQNQVSVKSLLSSLVLMVLSLLLFVLSKLFQVEKRTSF